MTSPFDAGCWRAALAPIALFVLGLFAGACDPSVTVLDPSEKYRYSLFGTLDVAADTQQIRVEPLWDQVQVGSTPGFPGEVALENLATGNEVVLHDSLYSIEDSIRVHNFWTTHPIQPETDYRVSVRAEGETVTAATATTPDTTLSVSYGMGLELPCDRDDQFYLQIADTERVAAVHITYPITLTRGSGPDAPVYDSTRVRYQSLDAPPGPSGVPVNYGAHLTALNSEPGEGCIPAYRLYHNYAWVRVADGGADWPAWLRVPLNEVARPDSFSNVKGGHGFVGGVYSDTIKVPLRRN